MNEVFKLVATITTNGKQAIKEIQGVEGAGSKLSSGLKKSFTAIGNVIKKVFIAGVVAASAAVVGLATTGIKAFADFEHKMKEVFTLLPELTDEAKQELSDLALDMSRKFGRAATDVSEAMYQAVSAGIDPAVDSMSEFLGVVGEMTVGGQLDSMSDGVLVLAQVMNAYGAETSEARHYSDLLFGAVDKGITTMPELAANMSKVTPIASSLGIAFEDITAWVAQLTAQGTPTAEALTYMKGALNELSKKGMQAFTIFEEAAGVTFPEFIRQGGSLAEAFEILGDYADQNGVSVKDLFGSIEGGQAVLMASDEQLDSYTEKLDYMGTVAGNTEQKHDEMASGIKERLRRLKAWWDGVQIKIGEKLSGSLDLFLNWLEDHQDEIENGISAIFDALIAGVEWIIEHKEGIKKALIAIAVGFAAITAVKIVGWIGSAVSAFGTLAGVIGATGPLGLAIAAAAAGIAGLRAVLVPMTEKSRDAIDKASDLETSLAGVADSAERAEEIMHILQGAINITGDTLSGLVDTGQMSIITLSEITDQLSELQTEVVNSGASAEEMARMWREGVHRILGAYEEVVPQVTSAADEIIAKFGQAGTAAEDLGDAVEGTVDPMQMHKDALASAKQVLEEWRASQEGAGDAAGDLGDDVGDLGDDLGDLGDTAGDTGDEVDELAEDVVTLSETFAELKEAYLGAAAGSYEQANAIDALQKLYGELEGAQETLTESGVEVGEEIQNITAEIEDLIGITEEAKKTYDELIDEAIVPSKSKFQEVRDYIQTFNTTLSEETVDSWRTAYEGIRDFASDSLGALDTFFSRVSDMWQSNREAAKKHEEELQRIRDDAVESAEEHAEQLLDIQKSYVERRADANKDLARDEEDLERKYVRIFEDLAVEMGELEVRYQEEYEFLVQNTEDKEKLAEKLADLEEEYAAKREALNEKILDKEKDKARDIEDMQISHQRKMEDLRANEEAALIQHEQEKEEIAAREAEMLAEAEQAYEDSRKGIWDVLKETVKDILKAAKGRLLALAAEQFVLAVVQGILLNPVGAAMHGGAAALYTTLAAGLAVAGFAKGALVTAPTLGMVGEGPNSEAIIPLERGVLRSLGGEIAAAARGPETIGGPTYSQQTIEITVAEGAVFNVREDADIDRIRQELGEEFDTRVREMGAVFA